MNAQNKDMKNNIADKCLINAAFDGWTQENLDASTKQAGYDADMARAVFPRGIKDVLDHIAHQIDIKMLEQLELINIDDMRIRDRIQLAVQTRLDIMTPNRESIRQAASYWQIRLNAAKASTTIWQTADKIWIWAGDTSTDYNRYTKRSLLSAVILSTMLYWFQDDSEKQQNTKTFLSRRIENVMQFGKFMGKIKSFGRKKAA